MMVDMYLFESGTIHWMPALMVFGGHLMPLVLSMIPDDKSTTLVTIRDQSAKLLE